MVGRENKYKTMQACFEPKSYLADPYAIQTRSNKIKNGKMTYSKDILPTKWSVL